MTGNQLNSVIKLNIIEVNDSIVTTKFNQLVSPILGSEIILKGSFEQLGTVESIKTTKAKLVVDNKHDLYTTLVPGVVINVDGIIFVK